ncbi:MAG: oligosaccharide flippase family protein, partial [Candidatus Buchananbacteria bacterium]|nr:oligosaccharide flippase family protein [Candidatus Buchananbacteria bacterium]
MSLTQKVAQNTIIQLGGKILSIFIGVITISIMARYLGKIGFGQYSTIMAYLQFFGILVDLGLALTVVRLIADPKYEQTKIFNNVFTLRFFSAIIFLGLAPLVIIFFPYDNLVKLGVAVTTLSFFFLSLTQILIGLFQKELRMDKVTISENAGRIILLLLVIAFAYLDKGLLWIMAAVVFGSLTTFLFNYFFALRFVKIKFAFDWSIWRKIIKLTWPIAISIAFNLVYFKADTLILSLVRSQAEVGIYGAPYRVLEIMTNFVYMFMGIIFPILTLYWAEKNWEKFKDIFQKTFDFLVIMAVPMIFGTLFVAKDLMLLIAGPEFAESGLVLKIIIFATAIIFINSLFGYSIVVINKQKQMVLAYIFVAIVSLVGYLIFIPKYGYLGAAGFTIIAEALIFLFNFIVTTQTTKYMPKLKIFSKVIAASLVMSLVLYLLQGQHVILLIILASIVYLLA